MAISFTNLGSFEALTAYMQTLVPEYFASVSEAGGVISCKDSDSNTILSVTMSGSNPQYTVKFKMFANSTSYIEIGGVGYMPKWAGKCGKGVMIGVENPDGGYAQRTYCIISKNNAGKTAFVSGYGNTVQAACCTSVGCTVWGDDAVKVTNTLTFTPEASYQNALCNFGTHPPYGEVSYLPDAYYMPQGIFYSNGFTSFVQGGKVYMTNGYWAILDQ